MFGEAIVLYDNLIHGGGESEGPNVRCFSTFTEKNITKLLDERNYTGAVKGCEVEQCFTCEGLGRLLKIRNGKLMRFHSEGGTGLIRQWIIGIMDLLCWMLEFGQMLTLGDKSYHLYRDWLIHPMVRHIDQELCNLKSIEKKRMMLSNLTATSASSSIKVTFPELHDHLTTSFLSVGFYLKHEYDMDF